MSDWRKDVETVREYIAHNATSKETPRAEALAALASLQAAYEAMERERDEMKAQVAEFQEAMHQASLAVMARRALEKEEQ